MTTIYSDSLNLGRLGSGQYVGAVKAEIHGTEVGCGVGLHRDSHGYWIAKLWLADGEPVTAVRESSRRAAQTALLHRSKGALDNMDARLSRIGRAADDPSVVWVMDRAFAHIMREARGWAVYSRGTETALGIRRTLSEAIRLADGSSKQEDTEPAEPAKATEPVEPAKGEEDMSDAITDLETQFGALGEQIAQAIRQHSGDPEQIASIARDAAQEAVSGVHTIRVEGTAPEPRDVEGAVPECFEWVLKLASSRIPILLKGPTGCGKTHLGKQVAEALDLTFYAISCTEGMSEAKLLGYLVPGDGGSFVYRETDFVRAYRDGGVFLFDELDAADPNVLMVVNQALANGWLPIPEHPEGGVHRHPDFVAMAAANTWGHGPDAAYVGRAQLDAATLDRFRMGMVSMDYSEAVEERIIDPEVLSWGRDMRQRIGNAGLRRVVSTRTLSDMSKLKAQHGVDLIDLIQAFMADWTEEERRKVS